MPAPPRRRALLALALAAAAGCETSVPVARAPEPAPLALGLPAEARLPFPVAPHPLAGLASVRVRPDTYEHAWVPYWGFFVEGRRSHDVTVLRFDAAFASQAARFAEQVFAGSAASAPTRAEIRVARSLYSRETRRFELTLTVRLLGRERTVLFQAAATASEAGDPSADPAVPGRAMDLAFVELARKVQAARERILAAVRLEDLDLASVEAQLLLGASRARGRSPAQHGEQAGRRFAVLVGVSDYPADGWDLAAAASDAGALFGVLNDPGNGRNVRDDRAVLLLDGKATSHNLRSALGRWLVGRVREEDSVILYFAGHGIYGADLAQAAADGAGARAEKYFLPADWDGTRTAEGLYDAGIPMGELTEYLARLRAREVVLLFDTCHSGAAEAGSPANELARLTRPSRSALRAILASAGPHQRALDGLFTPLVVDGLRGRADTDGDRRVTLGEASDYVAAEVPWRAQARGDVQQPSFKANDPARARRLVLAEF